MCNMRGTPSKSSYEYSPSTIKHQFHSSTLKRKLATKRDYLLVLLSITAI